MRSARDEIEELIKMRDINRNNFFEVSKFKYEQILRKIFYAFYNTEQKYMCLRLENENFYSRFSMKGMLYPDRGVTGDDWEQYIRNLKNILPRSEQKIYIGFPETRNVWLYEGDLPETIEILGEGTIGEYGDFFLVDKKMQWLLYYFDDGETMIYYKK